MLVSTEPGGLGNRIKSWVSARRIDPDARVFWPVTPNMPASFHELFVNDCRVDEVPPDADRHCSWRLAVLPEDEAELPAGFATAGGGAHPLLRRAGRCWWRLRGRPDDRYRYMIVPKRWSRSSTRGDGRVIDFEYERIPAYFRDIYRPLFAIPQVQPGILERVETFAAEHFGPDVCGVQVRTWRDSPQRYRKHHRPAIGRLRRLLQGADARSRFFVVSDDDDIVPWFEDELGRERVLAYPRETKRRQSWQSAAGLAEDLVDMLLLAKTDRLLVSYLSTFSETAWWIGGARASVAVF